MKRCSKCLLPETYPDIKFSEEGICNVCMKFEKKWKNRDYAKKEVELRKILDRYNRKKRRYHCVVPISGGMDSTYVLYLIREVYGLNPLAVNFDNGFQSEQARRNIENAVNKLNVDYITYKPKQDLVKKLYSCFLRKTGEFCTPCNQGITATAHRIAEKYKIPLIIYGFSDKLERSSGKIYYSDPRYFSDVLRGEMHSDELEDFRFPPLKRFFYRRILLPSYIDWNEKEIYETISSKIGWNSGSHGESPHHSDCLAVPVSDYLRRRKWGFGKETERYSALVRDGQISREEALEKISIAENEGEPAMMDWFLDKLNLTRNDISIAEQKSHLKFKTYNRRLLRIAEKFTKLVPENWDA